MIHSLFISREVESKGSLESFCAHHNIQLVAASQLMFQEVDHQVKDDFDIIFFSSTRSVDFFIKKNEAIDLTNKLIATAGIVSTELIISLGYKVAFQPANSGDITVSSREFSSWVGDKKVLFPCSDRSKRSYQQFLHPNQIEEVIVYQTLANTKVYSFFDVYVFTSPSNVGAFLLKNKIPNNALIIAWGETTFKKISEVQSSFIQQLNNSDEISLVRLLQTYV